MLTGIGEALLTSQPTSRSAVFLDIMTMSTNGLHGRVVHSALL